MKNADINLNPDAIVNGIKAILPRLGRYAIIFFLLLLGGVYGFVLYRIANLQTIQPNDANVTAQVQASATPHVDPTAAAQMQALQDNNVSVKTLFDQARNNPFQE